MRIKLIQRCETMRSNVEKDPLRYRSMFYVVEIRGEGSRYRVWHEITERYVNVLVFGPIDGTEGLHVHHQIEVGRTGPNDLEAIAVSRSILCKTFRKFPEIIVEAAL